MRNNAQQVIPAAYCLHHTAVEACSDECHDNAKNKVVKEGYHSVTVTTSRGKVVTGIKVRQTDRELILRGGGPAGEDEETLRADLLDLALLWTDADVRQAPQERAAGICTFARLTDSISGKIRICSTPAESAAAMVVVARRISRTTTTRPSR